MEKNFEKRRTYFCSSLNGDANHVWNIITSLKQKNLIGWQNEVVGAADTAIPSAEKNLFFELKFSNIGF